MPEWPPEKGGAAINSACIDGCPQLSANQSISVPKSEFSGDEPGRSDAYTCPKTQEVCDAVEFRQSFFHSEPMFSEIKCLRGGRNLRALRITRV